MEEERHAARAQVAVAVAEPVGGVHLRVGPEVADPLDVDDDQLVAGPLEREVAERLRKIEGFSIFVVLFFY